MSEFRYHRLKEQWTIIAKERLSRPGLPPVETELAEESPFAYGNEHLTPPEIDAIRPEGSKPNTPDWLTRVVPNKYRALSIENDPRPKSEGCYESFSGFGAHEVVIDQPDSGKRPHDYSLSEWVRLLQTIQRRLRNLDSDPQMAYIQIFKNEGRQAGATISHPHTQLIGLPMIPPDVIKELEIAKNHFAKTRRTLLLDMVHEEFRLDERIVFENRSFAIFCPYASRFPFEVCIAPKMLLEPLYHIDESVTAELADALAFITSSLQRVVKNLPYNLLFKTAPFVREHPDPAFFHGLKRYYPWHIEITPRLYNLAGFELASGMAINPVVPEEAARFLKGDER